MFEDYSERLFAHFVAGQWRAPFGHTTCPVPGIDGRRLGQVVPAGPQDVARAIAVLRGADKAARAKLAEAVEAVLPQVAQAVAVQTGQPAPQAVLDAMIAALRDAAPVPGNVLLSSERTTLVQLGAAIGAGVQAGLIWCPPPCQAVLATTLAKAVQLADLPPGSFALLHTRVADTEAALRATTLRVTDI